MARFDSAIALADRLIKKNGETSTLRRHVPGTPPDAAKPWIKGASTFTEFSVSAVWLEDDARFAVGFRSRVEGALIKEGDRIVLIAAKGLTITPDPATDHIVRDDGERWTISHTERLRPNNQTILFELRASKRVTT